MNKKIGIFDSGHGGLELMQYLSVRHASLSFHYVADLGFMPYGPKPLDVIRKRCQIIIDELISRGCEAIIIACNTATAVAIDSMREIFDLPIIGIEPYLNYINIAPDKDIENGSVGALVTPATFESARFKKLKQLRDPHGRVAVETICELAPLVEELIARRDLVNFKLKLNALLERTKEYQWTEVILGCTHYPLVGEFITASMGALCISPTASVAAQFEKKLNLTNIVNTPNYNGDCLFYYLNTELNDWSERKMSDFLFWRYPQNCGQIN